MHTNEVRRGISTNNGTRFFCNVVMTDSALHCAVKQLNVDSFNCVLCPYW
jgi:hypothetical protein